MSNECNFSTPKNDICITPGERKRVAEALRRESENECGLLKTLKRILGVDGTWRNVLSRLADLIDPTCNRDELGFGSDEVYCTACRYPLEPDYAYCPHCGARIIDDDE